MGGVEQSVREYADLGSWDKVAREIEEYDTMNYDTPTAPAVYVLGLLGYLNAGDCNGARYLYRRLPSSIQRDETVAAVADIARSLWQGDTMQAQTLLANRTWAEEFLSATKSLQERLQRQSIRVLSSAYSRISVQRVMESLGADKARAIALAAEAGLRCSEEEDAFVSAGNKAELRANMEETRKSLALTILKSDMASNLSPAELSKLYLEVASWVNCEKGIMHKEWDEKPKR